MAGDGVKKSSKLKWVLLIFILLLVIGGGAAKVERVEAQPVSPVGLTVPLSQFTTNLADPLGQRFIRMNLEVEVADKKLVEELARQNPRIRDSILMLLASKSYADIATTESRLMLKSEITDRLNSILGPGKIYQVFITDLVVQ